MSRSAIKHRLSPLSFLICIRRKLHLPIYPPNTRCTCGHHDHDLFGNHAFCCDKGSKKCTHNTITTDFATILSPALAQEGYIYPNTKLDIKMHLHLLSDPTARPFDIRFNPNPTSHHCCPIQPLAQTSPSQEPHHPQNVKLLKTSSKQSLPTQTTIFKCTNNTNLDAPPNQQQPPPHLYMATKSSANYTTKTGLHPNHD